LKDARLPESITENKKKKEKIGYQNVTFSDPCGGRWCDRWRHVADRRIAAAASCGMTGGRVCYAPVGRQMAMAG